MSGLTEEYTKFEQGLTVVGQAIPKADAHLKVTGRAEYIHDLELPGMLWGKILYSDRVNARILSIDTTEAERLPGVKAVLTAFNTPEVRFGFLKDNTALKRDRVRQYRDEVAAVAAVSRDIAETALALIRVEYEDLPAVFTVDEALADNAPLVHEIDPRGEPNVDNRLRLSTKFSAGDLEAGEAASAYVVEGEYETGWVTHCCLGTAGCVAEFEGEGNLTVHSSTQIPSLAKADFQEGLRQMGLRGKVRVVNTTIGGGFGSKLDTYAFEYIAILLAHRSKRPVKIVFDREEEFFATSPRQPMRMKVRQGCDSEGRLTFRDISLLLDNGAYTSWGATTPNVALLPASSLYRVPNVRFEATSVYTNNTYAQAMRGYGTPQVTFALECSMDELAEEAGIDPYAFRLLNANIAGEATPQGALAHSCGHKECLDQVAERLDWSAKHGRAKDDGVKVRGVGMACLMHVGGGANIYRSDGCATYLKMDDHGYIDVYTGSQDIGQGLDTVIRQIVAEVLGISIETIKVHVGDTDVCGWDAGCHASRSTFIAGNSALLAATEVRDHILAFAADFLDAPPNSLTLRDGMVLCSVDAGKNIKLEKLGRRAHFGNGTMFSASVFYEPESEVLGRDLKGNNSLAYTWGCHGVEVEVDTRTGQVEIVDYVAAHDVGRVINPLLLDGQVYGAIMQGVGYALSEELIVEQGRVMNPNFRDYKVLTALDVAPIRPPIVIETLDPEGPFGAKGVGEPGLVPVAPAIANAIYDAVGVRMHRLPMKAELILEGIQKHRAEGEAARQTLDE